MPQSENELTADVVIIGSGVAGALCAWRLASAGVDVLILEAGPRVNAAEVAQGFADSPYFDMSAGYPNPAWAPRPDWGVDDQYLSQAGSDKYRAEYLRVVGGTTWHWGGVTQRLTPADLSLGTSYGLTDDWPLDYTEMESWYELAEEHLGVSGPDDSLNDAPRGGSFPMEAGPPTYMDRWVKARLRNAAIDLHAIPVARNSQDYDGRPRCQGYSTCAQVCPSTARYCAISHVDKAVAAGARLLDGHLVVRLFAGADGNIRRAGFRRPDGSTGEVTGRYFVLAANGLESPRLLLASASEQFPNGLANRSDAVGRHLMDHPHDTVRYVVSDSVYSGRGPLVNIGSNRFRHGDFRREYSGFILSVNNRISMVDEVNRLLDANVRPPLLDRVLSDRTRSMVEMNFAYEQLPDAQNRVMLDHASLDSSGMPKMVIHYAFGEYEKRGALAAQQTIYHIGWHLRSVDTFIGRFSSSGHIMGTLRMGHDPERFVTDDEGRCHDHHNLYVAGSSLFTTGGSAFPTLTIAALSLRLAATLQSALNL